MRKKWGENIPTNRPVFSEGMGSDKNIKLSLTENKKYEKDLQKIEQFKNSENYEKVLSKSEQYTNIFGAKITSPDKIKREREGANLDDVN